MDRSINFLSLITLYSTFLGVILIVFLLFVKSDKNRANTYLGLLVLVMLLYLIPTFTFFVGLLEIFPHVIKMFLVCGFLAGPLIYFYVRSCTEKDFKLTPKLWLHFLPAAVNILINIPILTLSGGEKIELFYEFFNTGDTGEPVIFLVLKSSQALVYFIISVRLILKYKDHLNNTASSIDTGFHRWLLVYSGTLFIPIVLFFLFAFVRLNEHDAAFFLSLNYLTLFLFFLFILSAILFKPEIFHGFPHQMSIPESTEEKTQKYESSNLQETQKENYLNKLVQYVEKQKPYLESELTLSDLSEQTKIPSHYLSQVINEKLDCNFLDFINGYRITEAKEKLQDGKFSHYTIIAIAYESGFNSKSAFYAAFKKYAGTTPSAYRKSLAS